MDIDITNTTKDKVSKKDIKSICLLVFKNLNVINPIVSITIIDNNQIQKINKKYRNKDNPTDVISFAFEEVSDLKTDYRNLGEIYISIEKAKEQSLEYGHSIKREVCFLTVHGLLHLLGYDHTKEEDRRIMRKKEEEILSIYGAER